MTFEARIWLESHIATAANLHEKTWEIVSGFTLLWNLFENKLCKTEANLGALQKLAGQFGNSGLTDAMHDAYTFWANRYVENGATNPRFAELFQRDHRKRKIVEATILNTNSSENERFLALLIIVIRLRNNLFHGNKEIGRLNDQRDNLAHASRLLTSTMQFFSVS